MRLTNRPNDFLVLRKRLVEHLILQGIIRTDRVRRAMLKVPRELFVTEEYRQYSYEDHPLPLPMGQTISAPHMCAIMCEALELKEGDRVLEVGTGSGYHAALCAEIVSPSENSRRSFVVTLEYFKELAKYAHENLKKTSYDDRVFVIACDGSSGAPTRIKFDKVLVTAAATRIPESLIEQLDEGGKMVIPVGGRLLQELVLVEREEGRVSQRSLGGCVFVRLRGRYGLKGEADG